MARSGGFSGGATAIGSAPESSLSIEQLIEAARGGSREALGCLLEKWRPYLLLTAVGTLDAGLRDKVGATDMVHETLLKARHDFPNFRGQSQDELLAWLRKLLAASVADASRQFVDTDRRSIAREICPKANNQHGNSRSPHNEVSAREEMERIDQALKHLPEHYRVILRLRQLEHRSFVDIGRLTDRTPETARKLWFRAVERLRRELSLICEN